jgi:hypothetical protein
MAPGESATPPPFSASYELHRRAERKQIPHMLACAARLHTDASAKHPLHGAHNPVNQGPRARNPRRATPHARLSLSLRLKNGVTSCTLKLPAYRGRLNPLDADSMNARVSFFGSPKSPRKRSDEVPYIHQWFPYGFIFESF